MRFIAMDVHRDFCEVAISKDGRIRSHTRIAIDIDHVRFDNPPHSFIDEDGNWVGVDGDIAEALADGMDVRLENVKVDELTRISFLKNGKIDAAVASMSHTTESENEVDFSQPTSDPSKHSELVSSRPVANSGVGRILNEDDQSPDSAGSVEESRV